MAISRYRNVNLIEGESFYETSVFPTKEQLDAISTFQIIVVKFDRLDNLAFKHLGAGEYWWVIALLNDIDWMYALEDSQVIKIPLNVEDVLRLF